MMIIKSAGITQSSHHPVSWWQQVTQSGWSDSAWLFFYSPWGFSAAVQQSLREKGHTIFRTPHFDSVPEWIIGWKFRKWKIPSQPHRSVTGCPTMAQVGQVSHKFLHLKLSSGRLETWEIFLVPSIHQAATSCISLTHQEDSAQWDRKLMLL